MSRVRQVHGPTEAIREFLGEVSGAGTGFEGSTVDGAEAANGLVDGVGVVRDGAVGQDAAVGPEDADTEGVLGVVQSDAEWYSGVHVRLLPME
jgi:hypothetical protein